MAIDGYAIAAVGVGGILLWSSVRNEKILAVTRDLIAGKKPPSEGPGEAISGGAGTGGGSTGAAPSGPGESAFFTAVLTAILAPPTSANLHSLTSWRTLETPWPPVAKNNPLNTTEDMPGATDYNSDGVKNYPNATEGVTATARTLTGGYPLIVSALRSGKGLCGNGNLSSEFSTWSGGGYTSVC
jgi:hypothetical protein